MTTAMERFDILGLGWTAVDDLLFVENYPPADGKARVLHRERQGGGLTGTALVAAARLGARCQYAGTLGEDELSRFVEARLREEGIGLEYLRRENGTHPIHSFVVVDRTHLTRAIFYDTEGAGRAVSGWPPAALLQAARVLFVDHCGIAGMLSAAHVARAAGAAVVADFEGRPTEPDFPELMAQVDHLIVSADFASWWTGRNDPADAARGLWSPERAVVIVTCGAAGCWWLSREGAGQPRHQPAFQVEVVNTTGCGDVFHGAYAAGLAQGLSLPDRLRLASATAALKAGCSGGQAGIPSRSVVQAFLLHYDDQNR